MKRALEEELLYGKDEKDRFPLIIRGARQVGKSYLIEEFGKKNFNNIITLNFEFQPELKSCFNNLDPQEIIHKIELLQKTSIKEGETLLFFDEIQECPQAIVSLRYFKEKKIPFGIHISQNPLNFKDQILSIPLYLIAQIPRLIKEIN